MSDPFAPVAVSAFSRSVQAGCLSGLRFMAPGTPVPHDGVVYRSRGSVLIVGDSATAADAARELVKRAPKLHVALFAPGVGALGDLPPRIKAVGGRIVSLQGHLGRFSASVRVAVDKVEDAGIFSGNEDRHFDLVLDLRHQPLLRESVLPYGYYAPGEDAVALVQALDSLSQLTGDFHKPRYVDYRPQLCAHGAMGVVGCTRCLDVCATKAIRSIGEKIEVDTFLCHGCSSCTQACPTGALGFLQPTPGILQQQLNELLAAPAGIADARCLVVHDAASRHLLADIDTADVMLLEVDPLPAFSEALCLVALAAGCNGLVLVAAPTYPARSRLLVAQKLAELRAMLVGIGGDPQRLQVAAPLDLGLAIKRIPGIAGRCDAVSTVPDLRSCGKREGLLALLEALAASRQNSLPTGEPCSLETGAAFGAVKVDAGKCTVCLACTHLCPVGALSGELNPVPSLSFKEGLCVQCDLCRAGCPEQTITLQPRFAPDYCLNSGWRELVSDELVSCLSCGAAFIGRRKLAVSLALMQEYAPDVPGGIESLRKCSNCRQREANANLG